MRILVTGSREWTDRNLIARTIQRYLSATLPRIYENGLPMRDTTDVVVVHGAARGADLLVEAYCNGCEPPIKTEPHPVTREMWQEHPRVAGYMRNAHMVAMGADVCLAFILPCRKPDCDRRPVHGTHGASHCADLATSAGIQTIRVEP